MIKNILLDLDNTILDFHRTESEAIKKTLSNFGLEPTDEVIATYKAFNRRCWEALERGEMTRDEVLFGRFELLFSHLGKEVVPEDVQHFYERRLSEGAYYIDGAEDMLKALQGKYKLYIASNGTAFVQDRRIDASGVAKYFDGIFISERIGANKPSTVFFDGCFERMENKERDKTVIVGDTLSSDILGGINAGIHTIHYTLGENVEYSDIVPEYSARTIEDIMKIIEKM